MRGRIPKNNRQGVFTVWKTSRNKESSALYRNEPDDQASSYLITSTGQFSAAFLIFSS